MKSTEVAAVVVTRNRKNLLFGCVNSILNQSHSISKIYVIDNASTDDTLNALYSKGYILDDRFEVFALKKNIGGAGGFSVGLDAAIADGYDWIWLMDDDCIPSKNALLELTLDLTIFDKSIGFVCSQVLWKDGMPHRMNMPGIRLFTGNTAFNTFVDKNVLVISSCSFVSVLVSAKAVRQCGLPLSEMFLWGDDLEFFRRISNSGFLGLYAWKSVVTHMTQLNINNNIFLADRSELPKHYFGVRNNLYISRVNKGFFSYLSMFFENLIIVNFFLILKRKNYKLLAVRINTFATVSSLFFRPKIVFPK
jgi:GT2 family glycosyltransferase